MLEQQQRGDDLDPAAAFAHADHMRWKSALLAGLAALLLVAAILFALARLMQGLFGPLLVMGMLVMTSAITLVFVVRYAT